MNQKRILSSIIWKRKEKKSWNTVLSKTGNFQKEIEKPYSYGVLWTFVFKKNFETILKMAGHIEARSILDLGCGGGWLSEWLAQRGAIPIGVDISSMFCKISKARTKKLNTDFVCADGEHLPFKDGSFDLLITYQSLHHCPIPGKVIEEALRTSGRLIISDEPAQTPLLKILKLLKILSSAKLYIGESSGIEEIRFDPQELELTYRSKGYRVQFKREWSFVPAILVNLETLRVIRILYESVYSILMNVKPLRNLGHGFTMMIWKPSDD